MEHKKLAGSHATYISSDFIFIALNKTASCTSEKRERTSMIRFPFISLNPYCYHSILFICFFFKRNIEVLKQKKITLKDIIQYPNNNFIIINMSGQITVGQCLQPIFSIHDISTLEALTNRFTGGTHLKTF